MGSSIYFHILAVYLEDGSGCDEGRLSMTLAELEGAMLICILSTDMACEIRKLIPYYIWFVFPTAHILYIYT